MNEYTRWPTFPSVVAFTQPKTADEAKSFVHRQNQAEREKQERARIVAESKRCPRRATKLDAKTREAVQARLFKENHASAFATDRVLSRRKSERIRQSRILCLQQAIAGDVDEIEYLRTEASWFHLSTSYQRRDSALPPASDAEIIKEARRELARLTGKPVVRMSVAEPKIDVAKIYAERNGWAHAFKKARSPFNKRPKTFGDFARRHYSAPEPDSSLIPSSNRGG